MAIWGRYLGYNLEIMLWQDLKHSENEEGKSLMGVMIF